MKIIDVKDYPTIARRVIYVVSNPDAPRSVHADDISHPGDEEVPWETCLDCIGNWQYVGRDTSVVVAAAHSNGWEWNREELQVGLIKWGNLAHDKQEIVSTRPKTWDELYLEIDDRLGEHAAFGDAPRQAVPVLIPEVEPDFELVRVGEASMDEQVATQLFHVLRLGDRTAEFVAEGTDSVSFAADRDAKYADAQVEILVLESNKAAALAIVG